MGAGVSSGAPTEVDVLALRPDSERARTTIEATMAPTAMVPATASDRFIRTAFAMTVAMEVSWIICGRRYGLVAGRLRKRRKGRISRGAPSQGTSSKVASGVGVIRLVDLWGAKMSSVSGRLTA